MPYKIAVASGKGGTGKTTVSVNLFVRLNDEFNGNALLVDCDVEEPNVHIFFDGAECSLSHEIIQQLPFIDIDKCTFCRKCETYCEFNAIVIIPSAQYAAVEAGHCHSCGACYVACKHDAIVKRQESIGMVNLYKHPTGYHIVEGKLNVGSAMQTMLIKSLKKTISTGGSIVIYDAPPGTSCSVVETVSDADFVLLVAEPTLFGLHDLKLMVALLRKLGLPFGVVINKAGLGDNAIYRFLQAEGITLLGEIPFSKEYACMYAEGNIIGAIPDVIKNSYSALADILSLKIKDYERDNNSER